MRREINTAILVLGATPNKKNEFSWNKLSNQYGHYNEIGFPTVPVSVLDATAYFHEGFSRASSQLFLCRSTVTESHGNNASAHPQSSVQ